MTTITPVWRTEFPDFPEADMPAIPEGFEDASWRNDACPRFDCRAQRLAIWIDYAEAEQREFPESPRFLVQAIEADGAPDDDAGDQSALLATDDWAAVERFIADARFDAHTVVQTDNGERWTGTLAALFRDNADGIDAAEHADIRKALRETGAYHGGGGAAAEFSIVKVAPTEALLFRLREEVRDWQDALAGERPSLDALCAEVDRALEGA